ncbi:MAG: sugar phosphate isomerase/epimerase [Ruminococcaceae bacterium]|nr:sugar phosphate isomerase/epimerase [Oscillospiraceae bacterium]
MNIKDYKFGMRGHDLGTNFMEMCENAKKHGVSNLQFALAKTVNDKNFFEIGYDASLSAEIKKTLDEYNLSVSVLGCYINPIAADKEACDKQLQLFKDFILYAKDFGAVVIGTETGSLGSIEENHSEETYMRFVNNLKPLVAFAEECGVTVGIEPVWQCPISSPQVMNRLLDDIPSDNLAVIFDLSNLMNRDVYLKQRQIMDDAFALFGDKIKAVHVKDFIIKEFDRAVPVFGTGLLDIKYLFSKIQELDTMPELIMDDMRLSDYDECTAFLRKLLSE